MRLFSDSIGRKVVMAITGLLMVLFVVGHLLGNLSIFFGGINAYAEKLHSMPAVVYGTRVVMLAAVILHLVISIKLTLENAEANPTKYAVDRSLKKTLASKSMIYTGLILGVFIVYHLFHFTVRAEFTGVVVGPADALGRFDVYTMVVTAFGRAFTTLAYLVAMISLFLHLSHGVQSTFQSLGLSNDKAQPGLVIFGRGLSAAFLIGYGAIPVAALVGILSLVK